MTFPRRPPRLMVQTREIDPVEDILAFSDARSPLAWLRRGEGIVGIGSVGGYEVGGAGLPAPADGSRIAPADWWRAVSAEAEVDDPIGLHGTGLVAFGTLVFD
ncbi:MAG: isochorismate synthase, partial [Microbacterium sp.]